MQQSAIGNPLLFTGRRYEAETGLYWYRTRYYDPVAGRFTSRDVIGIWGDPAEFGNGYSYVGNNPGSFVDPWGLVAQEIPGLEITPCEAAKSVLRSLRKTKSLKKRLKKQRRTQRTTTVVGGQKLRKRRIKETEREIEREKRKVEKDFPKIFKDPMVQERLKEMWDLYVNPSNKDKDEYGTTFFYSKDEGHTMPTRPTRGKGNHVKIPGIKSSRSFGHAHTHPPGDRKPSGVDKDTARKYFKPGFIISGDPSVPGNIIPYYPWP